MAGRELHDWLESLATGMVGVLEDFYPELPDWLVDRPADVWEPLLAVADLAGGEWPERARVAAGVLLSERSEEESINTKLLADIRRVLGARTVIWTETLLSELHKLEESPWAD